MENAKYDDSADSFSWWQDSHNRPSQAQSPWLQATLSDLDEKTKVMVSIIEQKEGDSFGRRAEVFYRRRPELVGTIQELHKSYGCLAQRYKQLQSPSEKGKKVEGNYKDVAMDVGLSLRSRVMKLTEDSLYQQADFFKRNNENREAIRLFRSQVDRLVDQYRDLKSSLPTHAPHAQRINIYDAT